MNACLYLTRPLEERPVILQRNIQQPANEHERDSLHRRKHGG
jgi:hypothetical protein